MLLFDICLDLNACTLSYFWKERAYDGLLLQPALLTPDHGCPRLRVTLAAEPLWWNRKLISLDLQCGNQRGRSTLGNCFRSHQALHFQGLFTLKVNPICLHLPPLLSDFHRFPECLLTVFRERAQLVAFHQSWAFGRIERRKVF